MHFSSGFRGALAALALTAATAIDSGQLLAASSAGGGPSWWRHRPRKPWGGSVKRHARAIAKKARKG